MSASLFRPEALAHREARHDVGAPLLLERRVFTSLGRVLLVLAIAALGFVALARVDEYASGPAVVQARSRVDMASPAAGTLAELAVRPGDLVERGQVLARLHDAAEAAEAARIEGELELQLLRVLRDPSDNAARGSLITLRTELELARARLEQRLVRATVEGHVTDVRARLGQAIAPGDTIVSIVTQDGPFVVVAMIPGHYRPRLHEGMQLQVALDGFTHAEQLASITEVGDEIVGATEVRRHLGVETADTIDVAGPVVLAWATLETSRFVAEDTSYAYYDGMRGSVEISVRSEPLAFALVPQLRELFEDDP